MDVLLRTRVEGFRVLARVEVRVLSTVVLSGKAQSSCHKFRPSSELHAVNRLPIGGKLRPTKITLGRHPLSAPIAVCRPRVNYYLGGVGNVTFAKSFETSRDVTSSRDVSCGRETHSDFVVACCRGTWSIDFAGTSNGGQT